ncbi:MAG: class I SAM-dependent methyltransferase [bacterium]
MTEFEKSNWADPDFSQEYRENADIYIMERRRLLGILGSFYGCFIAPRPQRSVLDLGCGDGIISHELLKIDASMEATLMDPSEDMLNKAGERLKDFTGIHLIKASFQDLLEKDLISESFDFIVSSLAIHHLSLEDKIDLFRRIYSYLNIGGFFVNIDVVLPPTEPLEQWYFSLWKTWIEERKIALGIKGHHYEDVIRRYKDNRDNRPDTLESQLRALESVGFKGADCFYKHGIFAMFGGMRG